MATRKPHKYELRIHWSAEDKVCIAEVPDLPGCMTHGDTPAQAATQAEDAIGAWIDTARETGRPIPPPRNRVPV